MNILVMGAHPDDAECSCGGLVVKAVAGGHEVDFLILTNGDKYGNIPVGAVLPQVREKEAEAAAAIAGAHPHFLSYRDRELAFTPDVMRFIEGQLIRFKPDFVLAHWPTDHHPDHQICGVLATQALLKMPDVGLAYFEAAIGSQTFGMVPNRYFDITDSMEKKREMIRCHVSQGPENIIEIHDMMARWHGANMGVEFAEAYYMHRSTPEIEEFFARTGR